MPKKQEDILANAIAFRTVGNTKAAEEIANTILQMGRFRNILRNRNSVRNYMAASIYLLATHLPVEVQYDEKPNPEVDGNSEYPPVKYRSRVGDVAHLLVFLTYLPSQVFTLFAEKEELVQYLPQDFVLYRNGRNEELNKQYEQLLEIAHKIISEKKWVKYIQDQYVFRPPSTLVSQIMDPVPASMLSCKMMAVNRIYNRFVTDINRLILEGHAPTTFTLEELGKRLKYLRLNSDLTQSQLGDRIGVSDVAVSRIESGDKKYYSAETLFLYIRYFAAIINIDILFDDRMWKLAMQDRELLLKRVCTSSIVNRKLELLKQSMQKKLELTKQNLLAELDGVNHHVELGMNSILAFTEDEADREGTE